MRFGSYIKLQIEPKQHPPTILDAEQAVWQRESTSCLRGYKLSTGALPQQPVEQHMHTLALLTIQAAQRTIQNILARYVGTKTFHMRRVEADRLIVTI